MTPDNPRKKNMATTQTSNNTEGRATYGGASFDVSGYDTGNIVPDAYAGQYEAKFNSLKWKMTTAAPPRPMLLLEWKLIATEEPSDECQGSVGHKLTDYIVIANDSGGNAGKAKLRTLVERLELDVDLSRMNPETVNALGQQLKGKVMTVWVSNREDQDGNIRCNVYYNPPKSAAGGSGVIPPMDTGDEPEEEEAEEEEELPRARRGAAKTARK